jgi:hypothetical protein
MRSLLVAKALLAVLASLSFASLAVVAEERGVTDVGTLDKESAEKVFPTKQAYSPYAGRNFPTRPLFGDTHLHTMVFFRRRRVRRAARPKRRLSLR